MVLYVLHGNTYLVLKYLVDIQGPATRSSDVKGLAWNPKPSQAEPG